MKRRPVVIASIFCFWSVWAFGYTNTFTQGLTDESSGYCKTTSCFNQFPSGSASMVSVGVDNTTYVTGVAGSHYYQWSQSSQAWKDQGEILGHPVTHIYVALGPGTVGGPEIVALTNESSNNLYQYTTAWSALDQTCIRAGIWTNGTIFCVESNNKVKYKPAGGSWSDTGANYVTNLAVAGSSTAIAVTSGNTVYIFTAPSTWTEITEKIVGFQVGFGTLTINKPLS